MRNRATTPLSKVRLRQSWSKYNLYNLSRVTVPNFRVKNFFQQKWTSKSVLRDYHGEQVREGQWKRMFQRRLRSVVPMEPSYLAINDGSFESAGRGSGLKESDIVVNASNKKSTPYAQMTFAPLERRLDSAVFRAMFASSARQARQFVVHGAVKVNGKTMRYPGYLLNPGDLFQVEPERVMFATGAPKPPTQASAEADTESEDPKDAPQELEAKAEEIDIEKEPKEVLKELLGQARHILSSSRDNIGAKRKQDLRGFSSAVKRMLSRSSSSTILTDSLEAQFVEIQNQLKIPRENKKQGKTLLPSEQTSKQEDVKPTEGEQAATEEVKLAPISDEDYHSLFAALSLTRDNPIDDAKPYATPWMPRDYMGAFAFIPRYLEVNQNICAAVYLRHPVARPGSGEVPTPFPENISGTAYTWYLRRR